MGTSKEKTPSKKAEHCRNTPLPLRGRIEMNNVSKFIITLFTITLLNSYPYVVTENVRVSWDPNPEGSLPTKYEVKLVQLARTSPITYDFSTTENFLVVTKPRGGFFDIWVRAISGTNAGEWAKSTLDGTPSPWHIFFDVAPPSGGGIE